MTEPTTERNTERLGPTLRMMRESHGVSVRELARWVEVDHSHLSRIEKGERRVSDDLYERIVTVLQALPAERPGRDDESA